MSVLFSVPKPSTQKANWLSGGAFPKQAQAKARSRKRTKAQSLLTKIPTVRSAFTGEDLACE